MINIFLLLKEYHEKCLNFESSTNAVSSNELPGLQWSTYLQLIF